MSHTNGCKFFVHDLEKNVDGIEITLDSRIRNKYNN